MPTRLIGKKFHSISRAIDMLCLFLGEDYLWVDTHGKEVNVAEYAIHLQTHWRFRDHGEILLACNDIYKPSSEDVPEDWRFDLIGRPEPLSSVFDVQAKALQIKMQGTYVTNCHLSEANDMTITFSNGVIFEQFMPSSIKKEEWRLIDYRNDVHIVCYDDGGSIAQE